MLKFKFFGQGMKIGVFTFLSWLEILDRHALLRQYFSVFLRYIASQKTTMFIGFSGRKDIKSILPH